MSEKMNPTGQILSETEYTRSPQIAALLKRPIGRWGRMWQEWIRLEYPQEVQIYIMEGKWQLIPRQIDEEAEIRFQQLDRQYRSGNTGVGENAPADNRTSGDAGSRISVENVTPEILKKMRLDADFNRRLDNYEIAGWAFGDSEGMNITPIEYFNRFIADRYSVIQQQEIRDIMEAAIRNDKRLQQQAEPVEHIEKEPEPIPDEQPEPISEPEAEYADEEEPTESEP